MSAKPFGNMKQITRHSFERATDEAVRLWALASAQYPKDHDLILQAVTIAVIEAASTFALVMPAILEPASRWGGKVPPNPARFPLEHCGNDGGN